MVKILKSGPSALAECADALARGGIVAYPTETVYGLGVDAMNGDAVKALFAAKKRDESKPSSIAVADLDWAKKFAIFNETAELLASAFLPGPLTLVAEAVAPLPLLSLNGKVGVRVPSNAFAQALLRLFANPITATSANISGAGSVTRASDLDKSLLESLDIVADIPECEYAQGSTVVDVSDGGCKILREGAISAARIEGVLGRTHNL
ncbi:MAG: L-threonylcarbamoyladenylate synthase [Candidatus Marsarchaeota archaeon]|nr:L-threonylcarbamoyladenylate synthase [Candidatus Marsarchaeota archaeon]